MYVGNLSFEVKEEDLRELFSQIGTVESVRIITDRYSSRSKGFGFVEMASEEAQKAIEKFDGYSLKIGIWL
ncbi:MAG: RNA-binding protein [Actinomycetota bacterium]